MDSSQMFTVISFSGMLHGIKPFLEFSPNDRQIHEFRSFKTNFGCKAETPS
jgi:hypothetical protein